MKTINRKKNFSFIDTDYLLIIVLLIFSGNPISRFMGKYAALFASVIIFIAIYNRIKKNFYTLFLGIASGLLLLFLWQLAILGFVSWLGAFNYINTFFLGGLIIYAVGDRFGYKLFIVIAYLSLISLIFYVAVNLLGIILPGIVWREGGLTYIVYTYVQLHNYRNCGAFWEPGAFAGILTLCVALNLSQLSFLWQKHKLKVVFVVMALVTTLSTTGYVVFFLIGCYFMLFFIKDKTIPLTLLPILLVIGITVYTNASFLSSKLESQSEETTELGKGEFSNTRFGSFIFDMHYIKKHPIIGNGFHENTRYADNPELIQRIQNGQTLGNGNGVSNFLACLGIPFMFFYLLLTFKAASKIGPKLGFLVTLVIFLSLISEQWLSYPLFAAIMFLNYKKNVYE